MVTITLKAGAQKMVMAYETTADGSGCRVTMSYEDEPGKPRVVEGESLPLGALFQLLLAQDVDWELDLSAATSEERLHWGSADCATRIARAFKQSRPVILDGREYFDEESLFSQMKGRNVVFVKDDHGGLVIRTAESAQLCQQHDRVSSTTVSARCSILEPALTLGLLTLTPDAMSAGRVVSVARP
jgi:hypothetical protein